MTTKIAINGMGRIGRLLLRDVMDRPDLELVCINDIAPLDNLVYLLKYDSVHTDPTAVIEVDDKTLKWNGKEIQFLSETDPANLPWKQLGIDIVLEASGHFTKRDDAARHLNAGAKRVIITADAKGADTTICMGVNENEFNPAEDFVLSNASCTTNALTPVAKVIDEEFGIVTAFLTTVHAYTSTQELVDSPKPKEWRRGRAAALSIVPTSTGAASASIKVLPWLKDKMNGISMRVPVAAGSIIDLVVQTERPVTVELVNNALRRAAETDRMRGILGVTDDPIVSADIVGSNYSSLVDAESTMVIGDHTVKVLAWYDNEWGYARRVVDLAVYVAQRI